MRERPRTLIRGWMIRYYLAQAIQWAKVNGRLGAWSDREVETEQRRRKQQKDEEILRRLERFSDDLTRFETYVLGADADGADGSARSDTRET